MLLLSSSLNAVLNASALEEPGKSYTNTYIPLSPELPDFKLTISATFFPSSDSSFSLPFSLLPTAPLLPAPSAESSFSITFPLAIV